MQNVHPLFKGVLSSMKIAAARPFLVRVRANKGNIEELRLLAASSCDAVNEALSMLFDGDADVPALTIEVVAMDRTRAA